MARRQIGKDQFERVHDSSGTLHGQEARAEAEGERGVGTDVG